MTWHALADQGRNKRCSIIRFQRIAQMRCINDGQMFLADQVRVEAIAGDLVTADTRQGLAEIWITEEDPCRNTGLCASRDLSEAVVDKLCALAVFRGQQT
jgi:hypothetical protein